MDCVSIGFDNTASVANLAQRLLCGKWCPLHCASLQLHSRRGRLNIIIAIYPLHHR